jgi:type IV pilus assembly protein PilF
MKKIVSFSLISVIFLIGCSQKSVEMADSHYKMGLAYLNSDTDYLAIVEFEKAIAINDRDDRVYYAIGTFYIKKNRPRDAEKYIKKAIEINPENLEYQNALATLLAAQNKTLEAITTWKKIEDNPKLATPELVYYNMALAYMQLGQFQEAENYFKRSIEANPRVLTTYMTLSEMFIKAGKTSEAEKTLMDLLNISPTFNPARVKLAKLFIKKGNYEKAIGLLRDVITAEPNSQEARDALEMIKEVNLK